MEALKFEVVLHLAGEQLLPNYMGIKLCEANIHLVVATDRTYQLVSRIESTLRGQSWAGDFLVAKVPAYDFSEIHRHFSSATDSIAGHKIGFNVTGGTKPMFAAALDFCRASGATPFYVDTTERLVRFLAPPYQNLPLPPVFSSVSEFIQLAGQQVQHKGFLPSHSTLFTRSKLSYMMWKHRNLIRRWLRAFSDSTSPKLMNSKTPPQIYIRALTDMRATVNSKVPELMATWDKAFPEDGDWRDAAVFAAGGWFEENVLHRLAPLLNAGKLSDLRLGVCPAWADNRKQMGQFSTSQEFDISFTDGFSFTILECKAGQVKQDHIQKLENLRLTFGGSFGRAAIVSANIPDRATNRRLQNQQQIALFAAAGVDSLACRAIDFKPGESIQS